MKTQRLFSLLGIFLILSTFIIVGVVPTAAQGSPTVTYNFTIDDQGWYLADSPTAGQYTAATGWQNTCRHAGDGNYYTAVDIGFDFPSANTLTDIVVHYDATLGTGNVQGQAIFINGAVVTDRVPTVFGSGQTLEYHGSASVNTLRVAITSDAWNDDSRCNTGSVLITSIEIDGLTLTPTPTVSPTPTLPPPVVTEDCIQYDFTQGSDEFENDSSSPYVASIVTDHGWTPDPESNNTFGLKIRTKTATSAYYAGKIISSITLTVEYPDPLPGVDYADYVQGLYDSSLLEADGLLPSPDLTITITDPFSGQPLPSDGLQIGTYANIYTAPTLMGASICATVPYNPPVPSPGHTCELLGEANANGRSGSSWLVSGDIVIPSPAENHGLEFLNSGSDLLPGHNTAGATLLMRLNQADKYVIEVSWRNLDPTKQGLFYVGLGDNPSLPVSISAVSDEQTKIFPAANFKPNREDLFELRLNYTPNDILFPIWTPFVVTFVCVSKVTNLPPGGVVVSPYKVCESCHKPDDFLDLGGWFRWLGCLVRNVWECVIVPILAGVWKWLAGLLGWFISGVYWLAQVFTGGAAQLLAYFFIVLYYVNQFLTNLAQSIVNGLAATVGSEGSLGAFLQATADWATGLVTFVASILNNALSLIPRIVSIVFIITSGVLQGINNPNGYSVVIADNSLLNFLSLSFYVLDSTIFDGPVWFLVPMVMAFVSWTVLLWAKRQLLKIAAPTTSS